MILFMKINYYFPLTFSTCLEVYAITLQTKKFPFCDYFCENIMNL